MTTVVADMKIKAIAPWFGGKRTLAPLIVRELGPHSQYFEPFCGSMAVLFAKEPVQKETVCDLHGGLTCLARVIASAELAPVLYERLQRTVVCEGILKYADAYLGSHEAPEISIDYAYWFFVGSWMARNGVAGTDRIAYQIAVRWTNNGGSPAVRFRNSVESLPAWHVRLSNCVILTRDAFNVIPRFEDAKHTAIYIDPPYASETRTGWDSGRGESSRYLHDFHHDDDLTQPSDHIRLRDLLQAFKETRIVVSYYDCPRVRELYEGWTFVPASRQKNLHLMNRTGTVKTEAPEVLIINGPSFSEVA